MKKWIHAAEDLYSEIADIEEQVYAKLDEYEISDDDIYSINVKQNSSKTFTIEITIKNHRKKFKQTAYFSKAQDAIDAICYKVNAWLTEGDYVLKKDTYVALISIDDIPIGFYAGSGSGRGASWSYFKTDPNDAERFNADAKRRSISYHDMLGPDFNIFVFTEDHLKWNIKHLDNFVERSKEPLVKVGSFKPTLYILEDKITNITNILVPLSEADQIELGTLSDLEYLSIANYIDEYI